MTLHALTIEKNQQEIHYAYVNIYINASGCKTKYSLTIQAEDKESLEEKIGALHGEIRNSYENSGDVSVKVDRFYQSSITRQELLDYLKSDNLDTERDLDKQTL